jgi:general stress protein 26
MQHDAEAHRSDEDETKPLADIVEPGRSIMMGTSRPDGSYDFRPFSANRVDDDAIFVLVDSTAEWAHRFDGGDRVVVTVSDERRNTWATLHGTGEMSTDAALIDELWSAPAEAFFDEGRDTPGIAAMIVRVTEGRYWSSAPGRIGSLVSMVKAALGGAEQSGDQGRIAV